MYVCTCVFDMEHTQQGAKVGPQYYLPPDTELLTGKK